jgi:hypothetical protein
MTRRIVHLLKEEEDQTKLLRTIDLDVEVERTQENWKHLFVQESRVPTPEREEVLLSERLNDPQQYEVTMPRGDKNDNGKRKPVTQIIGKKARNLNKKKEKLENLQEVPGRNSQKEGLQKWNFIGISEQQILALRHNKAI